MRAFCLCRAPGFSLAGDKGRVFLVREELLQRLEWSPMTGGRDRLVGEPALNVRGRPTSVRRHRVTPPAVTTGRREVPALDGVRALAVLADHAGVPGLSGGFIGVDVFFVLSGFLITSLLLDEQRRTGRVDLAAFWARRARRLLPAAAAMVLTVGVCQQLFAPDSTAGLRGDGLAALGWVANWRFAYQGTDYFSQGGTASPLQHTWSLGVEEQYYLIWPLILLAVTVLIARRSRRAGGAPSGCRRRSTTRARRGRGHTRGPLGPGGRGAGRTRVAGSGVFCHRHSRAGSAYRCAGRVCVRAVLAVRSP